MVISRSEARSGPVHPPAPSEEEELEEVKQLGAKGGRERVGGG